MQRRRLILTALGLAIAVGAYWCGQSLRMDSEGGSVVGAAIVTVSVPELGGDAVDGAGLFAANCATCHGTAAAGIEGVGPPLVHKVYEPGHHADGAFYLAARQGVRAHHWPFGDMPPVDDVSQQDIGKIIAYVRALQRENGIY